MIAEQMVHDCEAQSYKIRSVYDCGSQVTIDADTDNKKIIEGRLTTQRTDYGIR